MKSYKNHTLKEYLNVLSSKLPAPGGGSAAALTAATGVALISMVTHYSLGKQSPKGIEKKLKSSLAKSRQIERRLLQLVDLDARAYLQVVKARKLSTRHKLAAKEKARSVPLEVCRLCYKAIDLTPVLVKYGNKNLISDIEVAVELLSAAFRSAMINVKINQ